MTLVPLNSSDGTPLAARVYEPLGPAQASIVIGGAMGVPQSFYCAFAAWLAAQGCRVTTFDYRGSGESVPASHRRSLRGFQANLFDWARDYSTVVDAAHAALPDRPLYLLGHSLGAQLPGLIEHPHKVAGLLSVAAGSGYWRDNAPALKRKVPFFWFVAVPLATRLCGYFPGRRLRMVGDLPAGVILQWRRWCLHPQYAIGAEGAPVQQAYARARFPVLALSMTDDELMTLRGTQHLVDWYTHAPRAVESIAPQDVGAHRIGHFGFFREQFTHSLWPRALQSLGRLATLTAAPVTGTTP